VGLSVTTIGRGTDVRLSDVACTLGRRDRPFPEVHERGWTIALVRRGSFRYRSTKAKGAHVLRAGWLLFGTPEAEYECSHDHDGGDDCSSLFLPEGVLPDVSRASGVACEKLLAAAPALPPLPRAAALLERARVRGGVDLDELGYLVAESVVEHACGVPIAPVARHTTHVRRVHDALDRIESRCREPLALADLADAAGFSPFHFLRVFRSVTGTTPHQYLIGARLRLASKMLLDTKRSVTEIAYEVGFEDLSNFMRTFRRVIGSTPRDYRRA